MRTCRVLALLLLAVLWVAPAWAEITREAQALMDNHKCEDGLTLSEVFKAAEPLGMKLRSAEVISLDDGQKALRVEYSLVYYIEELEYTLLWLLDSQGRQVQGPLNSQDSPSPGYLTAEIVELGKACWLHNINEYYEERNFETERLAYYGSVEPEEGKVTPAPVDPRIKRDLSVLALIPAQGYAGGVAEVAKKAGMWLDFAWIFAVPPSYYDIKEKGLYIMVGLMSNVGRAGGPAGEVQTHGHPHALWRRAPGSKTFEPMDDIARQLSAGIVPPEIK